MHETKNRIDKGTDKAARKVFQVRKEAQSAQAVTDSGIQKKIKVLSLEIVALNETIEAKKKR